MGGEPDWSAWHEVLDFVEAAADALELSGWSLGIRQHDLVHTVNRGFAADVSLAYAVIPLAADLPGPVTARTAEDQFFATRAAAHERYPLAAGIDAGSRHHAAATLVLRSASSTDPVGYLALHFTRDQDFDDRARRRLRRLADSIEGWYERTAREGRDHDARTVSGG